MFSDLKFSKDGPVYIQIKEHLKQMITKGMLQKGQKLPSSRELSCLLQVSRNSVIEAYHCLEDEGYSSTISGKGTFVSFHTVSGIEACMIDWSEKISCEAQLADHLDIIKHRTASDKQLISFTSIAPDESYFEIDNLKRAFLDKIPLEGKTILNYGYAKGYKPLMQYLLNYMESKGVDTDGKDILITNGFTEGFDIALSALCCKGQKVLCENPTHNTALKMMKLHGLEPLGVHMDHDGINLDALRKVLSSKDAHLAYLIPSYHNPTGIVMTPEKRAEALTLFSKYNLPVIEDGFNEELRYSGSHVAPLIACNGKGNNIIYIGSFSKILFPGLRVGWVVADKKLIHYMESLKRSRNIHTSTFDQALMYQYLLEGNFERYIKKIRKIYKEKYEIAVRCAKDYIPCKSISGEGGLHIFVELEPGTDSRRLLEHCSLRGVAFTPGDIFFTDNTGKNTLRIGFSKVAKEDIEKGIKLIGDVIRESRLNTL